MITWEKMKVNFHEIVINFNLIVLFFAKKYYNASLGYVPKEVLQREKVEIGTIALDAIFSPIRRVNYEVENMRVGDRTDYNRLKVTIETDGSIAPRKALEEAIEIMITQLKAIVGFKEEETMLVSQDVPASAEGKEDGVDTEFLKTRIDSLDLSARTQNALAEANIRTVGGLVRKGEEDLLSLDGLGDKGLALVDHLDVFGD